MIWRRFENGQLHFQLRAKFDVSPSILTRLRVECAFLYIVLIAKTTPHSRPYEWKSPKNIGPERDSQMTSITINYKVVGIEQTRSVHVYSKNSLCTICITRTNLWIETISGCLSKRVKPHWTEPAAAIRSTQLHIAL